MKNPRPGYELGRGDSMLIPENRAWSDNCNFGMERLMHGD
jgi:hypothetical protein